MGMAHRRPPLKTPRDGWSDVPEDSAPGMQTVTSTMIRGRRAVNTTRRQVSR